MIAATFDYARPKTLEEALNLLSTRGDDAKLLAGGHSLIPMMKLRLAQPSVLIDIGALTDLTGISLSENRITLGALTTHATLAASDELRRYAGALWDAANNLGDPQVRNRGTVGGACAHADPLADYPAVMLALDATFTLAGPGGMREIRADDFFRDAFDTALRHDEILTRIGFEAAPHSAYVKLEHPASHYALVGVASALWPREGAIAAARVALTGLGDVATRADAVEHALQDVRPSDKEAIAAACAGAAAGIDVRTDSAASAEYRRAMADVFCLRSITRALNR